MSVASTLTALCGMIALSSAHMKLAQPAPFSGTINSPISADGSNFPCQNAPAAGSPVTNMALGSAQPLSFIGEAVHGGGSCQVSITYDAVPTKNSVWKVIHSIQGGCPAKGEAGNLGADNDASAADPYTYSFNIPDNIPGGKATIAWSWLNRIGNREFYMNCAAVSLTGTGGAQSNFDSLPNMVVANIPSINTCTTSETFDYIYPNPGQSLDSFPFSSTSLKPLNNIDGDCGVKGASSGSSPPPAVSSAAGGASSPTTTVKPAASQSVPGGVFITTGAGVPNPVASTTAVVVAPTVAPSPIPSASTGSSSGSSSSSSGSSGSSSSSTSSAGSVSGAQTVGSACTDGAWACVGGTSFQRCGSGLWSAVMPLAAGTKCTIDPGSNNINIVAANSKAKRIARRFHS